MEIATQINTQARDDLRRNGFTVIRQAVDPALLTQTEVHAWDTIANYDKELQNLWAKGDLPYCLPMEVRHHHALLDHAEELLKSIGAEPYWLQNLMLIMKMPHEGRRFWHTDNPPIFKPADEDAPEVFVIYMLQPTSVALKNGCLLVVPGYAEGPQHSDRVTTPIEGEYPIETEMGDVIIMDPRLLHGSLPNDTDKHRFNVRLWIQTKWKER